MTAGSGFLATGAGTASTWPDGGLVGHYMATIRQLGHLPMGRHPRSEGMPAGPGRARSRAATVAGLGRWVGPGRAGPDRETGGEAGDEHRMAGLHFCFGERRVT